MCHLLGSHTWETNWLGNSEIWSKVKPFIKRPRISSQSIYWAAGAFIGQFRPLGAARNGCTAPAKGEHEFHFINRELHIHPLHPSIHFIHYSHTHSDSIIHHKERKELVAKEGELGAVLGTTLLPASLSLLFIPSMYLLSSVFIAMSS